MQTIEKARRSGRMAKIGVASALAASLALGALGLAGCASDKGGSQTSGASSEEGEYADLAPTTLILADCASPGSAGNLWSEEFTGRVSEITEGKLTIDYHGNSELGGDVDLIRQEQSNDIQMVVSQPAPIVSFIPELAAFDLPMVFATSEAECIEGVLNGENDFTTALQKAYGEGGLYNLGFLQDATFRLATSNRALNSLDDFKGFQVRTMENNNHMAFWQALGAEPTPLAFSEVYFALQNGTVDGQENPTDTAVGASLQEVQGYLCRTNHILSSYNMSINKEAWDALDAKYQAAVKQAFEEATREIGSQLSDLDATSTQTMLDAGMELIEYDDRFFEDVLALDGVRDLYKSISEQTNGVSNMLVAELEKS